MGLEEFKSEDAFYFYNEYRYSACVDLLTESQRNLFSLLPLLFHVNDIELPGYNGMDVPSGVVNYEVDENIEKCLRKTGLKNSVEELSVEGDKSIEAVYLQESFKTGESTLWVVCCDDLSIRDSKKLEKKANIISRWLTRNRLPMLVVVTSASNIANNYYEHVSSNSHIDKSFFFDMFYSETILLAGKLSSWWVIDDELIVENSVDIKSLNNDSFVDFDTTYDIRPEDYYSAAIWYLLNIDKSPMTTWIDLMTLFYRLVSDSRDRMFSLYLKRMVYQGCFNEASSISVRGLYADYLYKLAHEVLSSYLYLIDDRLLKLLCQSFKNDNPYYKGDSIYGYILSLRNEKDMSDRNFGVGVRDYISSLESAYEISERIFVLIVERISDINSDITNEIQNLEYISDRLLVKLRRGSKNLNLLRNASSINFTQDKVVIDYDNKLDMFKWKLVVPVSNVDQVIRRSESLVELIVWAYLNHVIDSATQISSHCPVSLISPTDIVNIVRMLSDNIDLDDPADPGLNVFASRPVPVKSIIFVDMFNLSGDEISAQINQLVIYNDGEFHTVQYSGYDNFIACIYNWYNLTSQVEVAPSIKIFGIKPGRSQELRASTSDLLYDLKGYFSSNPSGNVRTVLKKDEKYYVSHMVNWDISTSSFENVDGLYDYLETPLSEYTESMFTDTFDQDFMLAYILGQNKKNTIQLYYLIEGSCVRAFVFDENGALFTSSQNMYKRQDYINNWIVFFRNMQKDKKITVSVEINQLLKIDNVTYEHVALNGDILPSDNECQSLGLTITENKNNLEILFTCDNKVFSSSETGVDLYHEISSYISNKTLRPKESPVYLSNIDMPASFSSKIKKGSAYLIDYLRYKRNVELRLNQKINSLH